MRQSVSLRMDIDVKERKKWSSFKQQGREAESSMERGDLSSSIEKSQLVMNKKHDSNAASVTQKKGSI